MKSPGESSPQTPHRKDVAHSNVPEDFSSDRRGFLKLAGQGALYSALLKAGFSPQQAEAAENWEKNPDPDALEKHIVELEEALAPGGAYDKVLKDPDSSLRDVENIFTELQDVAHTMYLLHMFPNHRKDDPARKRLAAPVSKTPWIERMKVNVRSVTEDGREEWIPSECVKNRVSYEGHTFELTAQHCVVGTVDEVKFKTLGVGGTDVVVRKLTQEEAQKPENMAAMSLDSTLTDLNIQGKMSVMRSIDYRGEDVPRVSFLVDLNPSLFRKIFNIPPGVALHSIAEQVMHSFMMPLLSGDQAILSTGYSRTQGQSGTLVTSWKTDERGSGYVASGVYFASTKPRKDCEGKPASGLCGPMGFVVGIDEIKTLLDAEIEGRDTQVHVTGGFQTRVRRN